MRHLAVLFLLACSTCVVAQTYDCYTGSSQQGGAKLKTNGISSAQFAQQSFPGATVTVYNHATTTLSTIYANDTGTALVNPFTATSKGVAFWCAADGFYDVQYSGAGVGITTPYTITDIHICHACSGGGGGGTPSAPANSLQYNNGGAFGGSTNLTFNPAGGSGGVGLLTAAGDLSLGGLFNMTATGGTIIGMKQSAGTSITVPAGEDCGWFLGSDSTLHSQLSVALGGTPCLTFGSLGGTATIAQIPDLSATYVTQTQSVINAGVGFQIGGAAPNGHCLVGNGTDYIDQACSLGGTITASAGAGLAYYPAAGSTVQADTKITDDGAGALTSAQGSLTASAPWLNHTATWNNAAVGFVDHLVNVTCTTALATSKLFDFKIGGTSNFGLTFSGANCGTPFLNVPAGVATQAGLVFGSDTTSGLGRIGTNTWGFTNGTKFITKITTNVFQVTNGMAIAWSNNATDATATTLAALVSPGTSATAQVILSSVIGGDNATPTPLALFRASGATNAATNTAGTGLLLSSGPGTGNAVPSNIVLQAPSNVGTTGTTVQTLVDRIRSGAVKNLSLTSGNANNIIQFTLATLQAAGGVVHYVIKLTDGVDVCALTGEVQFILVNKGGVYTGTTGTENENAARSGTPCSSFATTWAFSSNTLQSTVTWNTLVPTIGYMQYNVISGSDVSITPQ